jgi:hypothetical protein
MTDVSSPQANKVEPEWTPRSDMKQKVLCIGKPKKESTLLMPIEERKILFNTIKITLQNRSYDVC